MISAINLRKIDKGKSKGRWQLSIGGKEFKDESKGWWQLGFQVIERSERQGQRLLGPTITKGDSG